MKFGSVLIVTYGRSGSTLLQGVLNSIDGLLVRGENYSFCEGLFASYASLVRTRAEFGSGDGSKDATSPWFGASLIDPQRFLDDARAMLRTQLAPGADPGLRVGFKEIRYIDLEPPRAGLPGPGPVLHSYLDFLAALMPDPAFVMLTRAHEEVARSAWWKRWKPATVAAKLARFEQQCVAWAGTRDNVFRIDYTDLSTHSDRVGELFTFLGAEYDRTRVDAVLGTRHSYPGTAQRKAATGEKAAPKAATGQKTGAGARKQDKGATTGGAPAAKASTRKPGAAAFEARDVDASLVPWLRLNPAGEGARGAATTLSGVLVLDASVDASAATIEIRAPGATPAARWGLASPKIAGRFPDNPNAAHARFRIARLRLAPQDSAEVRLLVPGQPPRTLLRLAPAGARPARAG